MGDRGNIEVHGVWLYTHWGGTDLKRILKAALERGRSRWDDVQYLTRIIFCEMVKDDVNGLTDFGLSNEMHDNEHNILHVNVEAQHVAETEEDGKVVRTTPFEDFIREEQGDLA